MKNLLRRTYSGILYLVLMLGSLFLGKYTAGFLFLIISLFALWEYYKIVLKSGSQPFLVPGLVINAMLVIVSFFICADMLPNAAWAFVVPLIPIFFVIALYSKRPDVIKNMAITVLGLAYITLPFMVMNYLLFPAVNNHNYTWRVILGILILIWANDTGAYLVGSSIGHHRLFERISPKKSWEGAIGGTILTLVLAYFMISILEILTVFDWYILAAIVSLFGVYGDMVESMLKRNAGLKDSGSLMPGHGGVLDRMDSILFVMPVAFFYLIIMHL